MWPKLSLCQVDESPVDPALAVKQYKNQPNLYAEQYQKSEYDIALRTL